MTEEPNKPGRTDIPEDVLEDLELPEAEGAEVKGGADYALWRNNFGQTPAQAGDNGAVDGADYVIWRKSHS